MMSIISIIIANALCYILELAIEQGEKKENETLIGGRLKSCPPCDRIRTSIDFSTKSCQSFGGNIIFSNFATKKNGSAPIRSGYSSNNIENRSTLLRQWRATVCNVSL